MNSLKTQLIASDLDGTLLSGLKSLSKANYEALEKAHELGIYIVPCTGRFYKEIPEAVRELPFIRYAITSNGASVFDALENRNVFSCDLALETATALFEYFDSIDVAYDCYAGDYGYMSKNHIDNIENYLEPPVYRRTIRTLREPVDSLVEFIKTGNLNIQKTQIFTTDKELLHSAYEYLTENFKDLSISSSFKKSLEITAAGANKGNALKQLAGHLGIKLSNTIAFGDGSNDLSMIKAAGIGIAMENAVTVVKNAADIITRDCENDGVAFAINKLILS